MNLQPVYELRGSQVVCPPTLKAQTVTFTPALAKRFKAAYAKAIHEARPLFSFAGQDYSTAFAKYVVEHLDNQFKTKD